VYFQSKQLMVRFIVHCKWERDVLTVLGHPCPYVLTHMEFKSIVVALVEVPSFLVVVISFVGSQMMMMLRTIPVQEEEDDEDQCCPWVCVLEVPEFLLVLKNVMVVELVDEEVQVVVVVVAV